MKKPLVMLPIALAFVAIIVAVPAARTESMLGFFVRIYDRTHLAKHPDQIVRAVKLSITKAADHYYNSNFSLQMQLRGRNKLLKTAGGVTANEQESNV